MSAGHARRPRPVRLTSLRFGEVVPLASQHAASTLRNVRQRQAREGYLLMPARTRYETSCGSRSLGLDSDPVQPDGNRYDRRAAGGGRQERGLRECCRDRCWAVNLAPVQEPRLAAVQATFDPVHIFVLCSLATCCSSRRHMVRTSLALCPDVHQRLVPVQLAVLLAARRAKIRHRTTALRLLSVAVSTCLRCHLPGARASRTASASTYKLFSSKKTQPLPLNLLKPLLVHASRGR